MNDPSKPSTTPARTIGAHDVVRRAYNNAITACARLHSFAHGVRPDLGSRIGRQQELLAADDLVVFAINARRLIETTIGRENALKKHHFRCMEKGGRLAYRPFWDVINIVVHHKNIDIIRSRPPKEQGGDVEARYRALLEQDPEPVPAGCIVSSDRGRTIAFRIVDLVEVFESWILDGIVDMCLEQNLDLDDADGTWD